MQSSYKITQEKISHWYQKNKRDLPWRKTTDPYKIWIAEVMLQQTTVNAVIPYYKKFIAKFPNIKSLALSSIEEIYPLWSGLGYYSRARNLYLSAKEIHQLKKFPRSYQELKLLPGFGDYTSRSVASFAFNQDVGIVDGNVIRFLSRHYLIDYPWWNSAGKKQLQNLSDQIVQTANSSGEVNQALIELGACICTATKPACLLCPISSTCQALKINKIDKLPIKRPKKSKEIWIWKPQIIFKKNRLLLIKNDYSPFLKETFIPPGTAKIINEPPKEFLFKHHITHHDIYVDAKKTKSEKNTIDIILKNYKKANLLWVPPKMVQATNPSSLLKKLDQHLFT